MTRSKPKFELECFRSVRFSPKARKLLVFAQFAIPMFRLRWLSLLLATLLLAESFRIPRHPRLLGLRSLKSVAAREEADENITARVYAPSPPPKPFDFFKLHPSESRSAQPFIASLNAAGRNMLDMVERPHAKHEGWR